MEQWLDVRSLPFGTVRAAQKRDVSRTERLLLRIPVVLALICGLALGVMRFVVVLREDLQQSPSDWQAVLFLAIFLAAVAALIAIASMAVGFVVGLTLQAGYGVCRTRRKRIPLSQGRPYRGSDRRIAP